MKKLPLVLFLLTCLGLKAQTWGDTTLLIDKILSRYSDSMPGAQLAIGRGGEVIYSFAKGMADLEHKVPLTGESVIEAGSISKQFTAACILLLEQQGKLSTKDDIRKYVPEIRDYGYPITIDHLIHHTSGLKDWGSIAEISGWPRTSKAYTNEDALHFMTLQKTLNYKPGDEFVYSNSNYNLMAIIIQRVSGMQLAEFSKKYIFDPAGMSHTSWRNNYRRIVPGRAIAYSKSSNGYLTTMPNENAYGNGGLITTVTDLLRWNNFYLHDNLGSPSLLDKQMTTVAFNNGTTNSYAAGLFLDSINGQRAIAHGGATAGYRANMEYFPDLDLSIAWLSNTSEPAFGDIFSKVRNLLVQNLSRKPTGTTSLLVPANAAFFSPYLGPYSQQSTGAGLVLYSKDTGIFSTNNAGPLTWVSDSRLSDGGATIEFISSSPRKFKYTTVSGRVDWFAGVDSARTDEKSLREYEGEYHSEETETAIRVVIKEGKLCFIKRVGIETILSPVYRDGFKFPSGDIIFERKKRKTPDRFFISISRARKVLFIRKN